ncbi:MAG: hypothetical protein GX682_01345 [Clostridiaceae bacterium]|nr:hypothetical protein [Clostridiaceae bacterium]
MKKIKDLQLIGDSTFVEGAVIERQDWLLTGLVVSEYYKNEYGEKCNQVIGQINLLPIALQETIADEIQEFERQISDFNYEGNMYISESARDSNIIDEILSY